MELKVQVKFKLGDIVYWMDNDDSKWWYDHLFTGVIRKIIISDDGDWYYAETTAAEDILTNTDETKWHRGGGSCEGRDSNIKFFTDKQKLLEVSLSSRLERKLTNLSELLVRTTEKLKTLQKTLKNGPKEVQKLKTEITTLKEMQKDISKRLKRSDKTKGK